MRGPQPRARAWRGGASIGAIKGGAAPSRGPFSASFRSSAGRASSLRSAGKGLKGLRAAAGEKKPAAAPQSEAKPHLGSYERFEAIFSKRPRLGLHSIFSFL